jgi:hypothetical protein
MHEVAPGHPVARLRFVVGRATVAPSENEDGTEDAMDQRPSSGEPVPAQAREAVRSVAHDRLRAAIEAALRSSYGER